MEETAFSGSSGQNWLPKSEREKPQCEETNQHTIIQNLCNQPATAALSSGQKSLIHHDFLAPSACTRIREMPSKESVVASMRTSTCMQLLFDVQVQKLGDKADTNGHDITLSMRLV
jgi:hypothetical protein